MFRFTRRLIALGAFLLAAGAANAAPPRYPDIMPLSQVHAGMEGYGLTVFRGTKIERFHVTVVGVVKKGSLVVPGHDMILVHMSGGPMTLRQANLIKGMSGSPVYVNGKIIGAFSQGEPTTKEPLGGVTPIEDMLEAWDPKLPATPTAQLPDNKIRTATLDTPIRVGDRAIRKVVYNVPQDSSLHSSGSTLVMHPCTTFATFSGLSRSAREKLAAALKPYNVELVDGAVAGGRAPWFKGAPLVPGAAFSMMLVTGDVQAGATGTVSYRKGNRILGFGHPFMGIGPIDAPLTSAYIYDVYPLLAGSYKISSPGPVVGTSTQDRNFAVSGILGKMPNIIPVTVEVRDLTTGRAKVFHAQAVSHPLLYSAMVSAVVDSAVSEIRNTPGAAMAHVTTTVDADELGKITRSNLVYDARGIDAAATTDLDDLLGMLTSNPFYPLGIKDANVRVEIESAHRTAQIERIFVKEGKFEPGETAEVGVVLKPFKQPAITKTLKIVIPPNTPSGRYVLQVRGGAVPPPIVFGGLVLRPAAPQNPDQAPPVSIRQMVNRYLDREKNNDMVARIVLPSTAVNVEGEKFTNLPPSLDAIMRSAKSSAVRLERDEIKQVVPTDWVVSGQQVIAINVQRKEIREGGSPATPTTAPSIPTPTGLTGTAATVGGTSRDDEESAATSDKSDVGAAPQFGGAAPPAPNAGGATGYSERASYSVDDAPGKKNKPADKRAKSKKQATDQGSQLGTAAVPTAPSPQPAVQSHASAPTPAAPEASDKPVARQAVTWRQTSRGDFSAGVARGVSVTTQGDLRLARSLQKVQGSTESFLWSLIPDGRGGLFGGTGTQGHVVHFLPGGTSEVYARLPEVSVQALALAPDATLYAGTSPNGRVYKITPDGRATVALQAGEKYALALARDSRGNIYVGTGGGGTIYRIDPTGASAPFFKSTQQHVMCLAVDKKDMLYAGTSTDGLVYRIDPSGRGTVIYDAPEQSITGLAIGQNGALYAATAPRGVIYRIDSDGAVKTIFDKSPVAFTALSAAPDGVVYASAGNTVYAVRPDDTVAALENRLDVDILSLATGVDGTVYAGTGNVAEVYSAAPYGTSQTGTYESVVHDAKQRSRWGEIRWTGVTPPGTQIVVETRTGSQAEPDATWSAWSAARPTEDGARITSPEARFIQYRLTLSSDHAGISPAVRDVSVDYLPKNQPPAVAFAAPAGGERWAKQQTIRWQATDPDKDTLSYQLYYSPDHGESWKPLPGASSGQTTASAPAGTGNAAGTAATNRPPSVAEVTAELDKHPDVPAAMRDQIIAQTRQLNDEYGQKAGQTPSPAASSTPTPSALRETTKALDTKALSDGSYLLKVVATDRPSNPTDPQSAEAVSESFMICNTPPTLYLPKEQVQVETDGSATIAGAAMQHMIPVTAVQYRVDGGEWMAAAPADGIFDSQLESFTIHTSPLSKGAHTVEVKAFNGAGLSAADKVSVEVK